jgi:excisionase family DNA binding protein
VIRAEAWFKTPRLRFPSKVKRSLCQRATEIRTAPLASLPKRHKECITFRRGQIKVEASKMKKHAAEAPPVTPAVMTVRELSAYLHVHPTTIYRLLRNRQIPGFRIDGDWRFHIKAIDEWRAQKEIASRRPTEKRNNKGNGSRGSAVTAGT